MSTDSRQQRRPVVMAFKPCRNLHFAEPLPGEKLHPGRVSFGGGGVVAAPTLLRLGFPVALFGRCAATDNEFKDRATAMGIEWAMLQVADTGGMNAILPHTRILRVAPTPQCNATAEEARQLAERPARAMAATGSLENDYVAMVAEIAAARGLWFFWNANASADLRVADCGAKVCLQVSAAEFGSNGSSASLARELLVKSSFHAVIVTDSELGAHGIARGSANPSHAPAIPVAEPAEEVGAGDAHFAGVIAAFLQSPVSIRMERALAIGRLVAARHVSGLTPGDWCDLRQFAERNLCAPIATEAA